MDKNSLGVLAWTWEMASQSNVATIRFFAMATYKDLFWKHSKYHSGDGKTSPRNPGWLKVVIYHGRIQKMVVQNGDLPWYSWWKKSCTTWDVKNLVNNGNDYLSTSAGFLPSTVFLGILSCCQRMIWASNHFLSTVLVLRFHYHSQKDIGSLGYGLNSWDG